MIKAQFHSATRSMDIVKDGEVIEAGVSLDATPSRLSFHRNAQAPVIADTRTPLCWRQDGTPVYKQPRKRRA